MKKFLALSLAVLFLFLCACKAEPEFKKGDLLFDLGIHSLDDIDHCGLWYFDENTPKAISAKITEPEDYEFLSNYKTSGDYDAEKLHELFALPGCQRITLKCDEGDFLLYVFEDGTIVAPVNEVHKVCIADNPITFDELKELAEEYKRPEIEL